MSKKSKHNRRDRKSGDGPIGFEHQARQAANSRGLYVLFHGAGAVRRWTIWDKATGTELGIIFPGPINPNSPPADVRFVSRHHRLEDRRDRWCTIFDMAAAVARELRPAAAARETTTHAAA